VEELVRRFRDEKGQAIYRRIVGALGEDLTYRLMSLAWEVRNRIAVSPGPYFMGIAKMWRGSTGLTSASPPPGLRILRRCD
jgi:hypothetical protein